MAHKIDSQSARKRLAPRREPYWHKLTRGRYIGFRRTATGGGWIARLQDDTNKKSYHAMGESLDYDEAVTAALGWFAGVANVEDKHYRVRDAVADYIQHLALNNSAMSARDAELRLKKHVPDSILKTEVSKLTTVQLTRWHQSLVRQNGDAEDTRRSKDGANKLLAKIRAALNLAFRSSLAGSDREWRKVRPFKKVGAARLLFLTDEQVRVLLDHCPEPIHSLVAAAALCGARYGELCTVRVEDFDAGAGTVTLSGKTGSRQCYLSDDGVELFASQTAGKAPGDLIFQREPGIGWRRGDPFIILKPIMREAGLPDEAVFYSLRHYHISKALLAGLPALAIAQNCGTSVAMLESNYGKFMPKDRRAMFNRVALL